jgi:hypothetical protein
VLDIKREISRFKMSPFLYLSLSRYDVANLKVRLGEYDIKQTGETEIFESKAARVVRHKEFSQQTLVTSTDNPLIH